MFMKIKQKLWEDVEAAFKCPAAKVYNFCSFPVYSVLLNLVHILKCETNLTILST